MVVNNIEMKLCPCCNEEKPITNFHKNQNWACKACINQKRIRRKIKNYPKHLLNLVKERVKKHNLPFDLTEQDIVIPEKCPALGLELKVEKIANGLESCPTIDRLIPALGYIKNNIKIVSYRCNSLKKDATLSEMRAVLKYMKQNNCP